MYRGSRVDWRIGLKNIVVGVLLGFVGVPPVSADVLITLRAKDKDARTITGPIALGTTVVVDILMSATPDDVPLDDVRLFQFDFGAVSASLDIGKFTWLVSTAGYGFRHEPKESYAVAGAASLQFGSDPSLVVLTADPVRVATVEVVVNGDGALALLQDRADGQANRTRVDAGFNPRVKYSREAGNLIGGTLAFSVGGVNSSHDTALSSAGATERRIAPVPHIRKRKCGAMAMNTYLFMFCALGVVGMRRR